VAVRLVDVRLTIEKHRVMYHISMSFTTRPELRGTFGMIASTHWVASAAGFGVLERGGNAFDAAVAAGFVLQVVEPHLNGPAGELPAVLWSADRGSPIVLCGQGPAPHAATIAHYRDELGLASVPGTGPLAAVVPGAFGGWLTMLRDFGTVRLRDVLQGAIDYAEHGFPIVPQLVSAIASVERLFLEEWHTSADVYLPVPTAGRLQRNPGLAATYQRILEDAEARTGDRDGQIEAALACWYEGFVAEEIVAFQQQAWRDSSGERHSGLLAEADLAGWRPSFEEPASLDFGALRVLKPGPWSQGPVFLQQLSLLAATDLERLSHGTADYVHTLTELAKLAFADREAWYGDPEFVDVPLDALLSSEYAVERVRLLAASASLDLRPGSPGGRTPHLAQCTDEVGWAPGIGEPTRGDTVHLDVVDRFGNMVSATPSGGWLTSAPVIPALGFCLGNRAQMFWLDENVPSALEPGKRPRTTLSPTLVMRDGEPWLAIGTPGGDQQDQWALHVLLGHVLFGHDLQAAIDAPNHHTEAFPSSFYPRRTRAGHLALESRFAEDEVEELRRRGHDVELLGPWSLGRVTAVAQEAGMLKAAANPRGMQGYAVGR
jgi:gamma-glutamyltranspeptidase / glutathione hydrolase